MQLSMSLSLPGSICVNRELSVLADHGGNWRKVGDLLLRIYDHAALRFHVPVPSPVP